MKSRPISPEEQESMEQLKRCTHCGRPIDMPAKNMEEIEKLAISNAGRSIYYAVLERSLRSIDLCNQCYSMMQAYRHSLSWEERGYNEREYQPKFTLPEAAVINVAHLAAGKAIPENWEKQFDREFRYTQCGQWLKRVDGYEDENDQFIVSPNEAYAVPEFVKGFIRNLLKRQRSEVAREILEKWTTRMAEIQDDLDEIYPDNSYHPNCGGILEGITEEYLKENEE